MLLGLLAELSVSVFVEAFELDETAQSQRKAADGV